MPISPEVIKHIKEKMGAKQLQGDIYLVNNVILDLSKDVKVYNPEKNEFEAITENITLANELFIKKVLERQKKSDEAQFQQWQQAQVSSQQQLRTQDGVSNGNPRMQGGASAAQKVRRGELPLPLKIMLENRGNHYKIQCTVTSGNLSLEYHLKREENGKFSIREDGEPSPFGENAELRLKIIRQFREGLEGGMYTALLERQWQAPAKEAPIDSAHKQTTSVQEVGAFEMASGNAVQQDEGIRIPPIPKRDRSDEPFKEVDRSNQTMSQIPKTLFVLDFDKTLSREHTYWGFSSGLFDYNQDPAILRANLKEGTIETIRTMLASGNDVVIATRNDDPRIVFAHLKAGGMTDNELMQIKLHCNDPVYKCGEVVNRRYDSETGLYRDDWRYDQASEYAQFYQNVYVGYDEKYQYESGNINKSKAGRAHYLNEKALRNEYREIFLAEDGDGDAIGFNYMQTSWGATTRGLWVDPVKLDDSDHLAYLKLYALCAASDETLRRNFNLNKEQVAAIKEAREGNLFEVAKASINGQDLLRPKQAQAIRDFMSKHQLDNIGKKEISQDAVTSGYNVVAHKVAESPIKFQMTCIEENGDNDGYLLLDNGHKQYIAAIDANRPKVIQYYDPTVGSWIDVDQNMLVINENVLARHRLLLKIANDVPQAVQEDTAQSLAESQPKFRMTCIEDKGNTHGLLLLSNGHEEYLASIDIDRPNVIYYFDPTANNGQGSWFDADPNLLVIDESVVARHRELLKVNNAIPQAVQGDTTQSVVAPANAPQSIASDEVVSPKAQYNEVRADGEIANIIGQAALGALKRPERTAKIRQRPKAGYAGIMGNTNFAELYGSKYDVQEDAIDVGFLYPSQTLGNHAIESALQRTVADLAEDHKDTVSGTTMNAVVIHDGKITCANVGDSVSYVVLYVKGEPRVVALNELKTLMHQEFTEALPDEMKDMPLSMRRFYNDGLETIRSIGDSKSKSALKNSDYAGLQALGDKFNEPDIRTYTLEQLCQEVGINLAEVGSIQVLTACDGLYETTMKDETSLSHAEIVQKRLKEATARGVPPSELGNALLQGATTAGSTDNKSAIVSHFKTEAEFRKAKQYQVVFDGHKGKRLDPAGGKDNSGEQKMIVVSGEAVSADCATKFNGRMCHHLGLAPGQASSMLTDYVDSVLTETATTSMHSSGENGHDGVSSDSDMVVDVTNNFSIVYPHNAAYMKIIDDRSDEFCARLNGNRLEYLNKIDNRWYECNEYIMALIDPAQYQTAKEQYLNNYARLVSYDKDAMTYKIKQGNEEYSIFQDDESKEWYYVDHENNGRNLSNLFAEMNMDEFKRQMVNLIADSRDRMNAATSDEVKYKSPPLKQHVGEEDKLSTRLTTVLTNTRIMENGSQQIGGARNWTRAFRGASKKKVFADALNKLAGTDGLNLEEAERAISYKSGKYAINTQIIDKLEGAIKARVEKFIGQLKNSNEVLDIGIDQAGTSNVYEKLSKMALAEMPKHGSQENSNNNENTNQQPRRFE